MNILGISGSVGWDGNISMFLPNLGEAWVHGSGAALVMDGVLKNAISDAHKRCAMRVGLGLHLYAQDDYFLLKQLEGKNGGSQNN